MHRLAAGSQLALRGRLPRQALRVAPLPLKPAAVFPEPVSVTHRNSQECRTTKMNEKEEERAFSQIKYLRPPRGPLDAAHYLLHAWIGREVPPEELAHSPPRLLDRRLVMDRSPRLFCKNKQNAATRHRRQDDGASICNQRQAVQPTAPAALCMLRTLRAYRQRQAKCSGAHRAMTHRQSAPARPSV